MTNLNATLTRYINKRLKETDSGFTLVELIVVVVIIGILSSIAIPSFQNASEKAKQKEASSLIASYLKAAQAFYTENSLTPSKSSDLGQYITVTACKQGNAQYCKTNNTSLINYSGTARSQWFSPNGHFDMRMQVSGTRVNFLAYPVSPSGLGVIGCYDSLSGATKLKENSGTEKGRTYVKTINCR